MRWIKFCGAVLAAMSIANLANAGFCGTAGNCGASKGSSCASTSGPACCKPVIVRPCGPTVHTYQRRCSDIKPPCCDSCAPGGCSATASKSSGGLFGSLCGSGNSCTPGCAAPASNCVGAGAGNCAPACAAPAANCGPAAGPACAAPAANCGPAAGPACAAPAANCGPASGPGCAAPASACGSATNCSGTSSCGSHFGGGFLKGLFAKHNCASTCAATCGAPDATSCTAVDSRCCNADPCEIAKLIYTSQTACYARQRSAALRKLGNRYDCICNPEIMTAFIYGLNDADERVRSTAAKEIGDQVRKNCCCSPEVVAALTCALGDCDRGVRRTAERALRSCGYDIVDGNCDTCVATGCNSSGCAPVGGSAPSMTPSTEPVSPAPVPPMEKTGSSRKGHLSNVLGMRF